jgi:medium-chain acyl-[acyl-carrier-protein] hydrolase
MNTDGDLIHRDHYRVTTWDADPRGRLSPSALGRYLQETALNHADVLGFGMVDLHRDGLVWVLGSLLVRVERYPVFQQEVILETWPRGVEGLKALREFRLLDAAGEQLAAISGAYLLIDLRTRRATKLARFSERDWHGECALDRGPRRLAAPQEYVVERAVPLRWSDIDLLGHVTNTRYLDLALESYDAGFLAAHEVAELELNFLAEGTYPDTVLSRRAPDPADALAFYHSLTCRGGERELYRARLRWRPF